MSDYVKTLMADVVSKNPSEPEFHQAVEEVAESLDLVLEKHPEYRSAKVLERIIEPERVILFRVGRSALSGVKTPLRFNVALISSGFC